MKLRHLLQTRFRSQRLWVRLSLGLGSLLALMLVVVVISVQQFRELARYSERLVHQDLQRMIHAQEIYQDAQGHGSAMARLLTAPRSEREQIYPIVDAEFKSGDELLQAMATQRTDAREVELLDQLVARRTHYREVFSEIVVWIESEDLLQARTAFNASGQQALKSLLAASLALMEHERASMKARHQAMQSQIARSEWLLAALAAAALGLTTLVAWRTTVSVARPLGRIEDAAHRVAEGNYAVQVNVRGHDELGKVAQAMNAMAAAVATREAEIERLAFVDRLTGLPNRAMLLRQARAMDAARLCVILIDVARLRTVNEVLGFDAGDNLLTQTAQRLRDALAALNGRSVDPLLARLAGGVFVILLGAKGRLEVEAIRTQVDRHVAAPLEFAGHAIDVSLHYGLALADSVPAMSAEQMLRRAELACTQAKRAKQAWAWYAAVDDSARARQLSLLSNLRNAAAAGELEMWLQPKQCLRSQRVLGMEALVRWRHPQWGYVSPAEFIPFAERTGHIGVVTETMIDAAMAAIASWQTTQPQLSIAVNVSALDIQDPAFARRVAQIAKRHSAPLARLRLEITESSLMEDADRVLPVLQALRDMGVQLSIDDFGTGYSSLAYLNRLPVNELKIDRSFVTEADLQPDARALLRTIIDLGHSLNMFVTAEGIERPEELALLAELGCDQAQGYLISRPLDPQAAARYVAALAVAPQEAALA